MYEAWVETVVGLCPEAIKNQRWFEQKRRIRKRKRIRLIVKENVKLGLLGTRLHKIIKLESCKQGEELKDELGCHYVQAIC